MSQNSEKSSKFCLRIRLPKSFGRLSSFLPKLKSSSSQSPKLPSSSIRIDTASTPRCITTFPARVHRDELWISKGAIIARKKFENLLPNPDYRSHSMGPYGNFFSFCWPEGKKERVRLGTEIIETLWLYDGRWRSPYLRHYAAII